MINPSKEKLQRELRLAKRQIELDLLKDKGLVKRRSYEGSFVPVMPDTPPPTPIRNDYLPPPQA